MPSFDIVSKVDLQEVSNAVNQALKEIGQRYDFKGSRSQVTREEEGIKILAEDEFRLKAIVDILQSKFVKRKVSLKAFQYGRIEPAAGGMVRQLAAIQQGVSKEEGRDIIDVLKKHRLKVQAQFQDDQVRVSGKSRDELQAAIALLKEREFGLDLQFVNYRD